MKNVICTLIFILLATGFCSAAELFVPAEYPTIQAGVDAAGDGDTVIVADGVYTGPGNRNILIKKSITVKSQNGAARCVIDCVGTEQDPAAGFRLEQDPVPILRPFTHSEAEQVIPEVRQVVIEGFTIQNGYYNNGGGICISGHYETRVANCRLVNNVASRLAQMDDLRLIMTSILDGRGGGIRCDGTTRLVNCVIEGNQAENGGGVYCGPDTTILHCTITGNQANQQGGGIFYTVAETTDPGREKAELVNSIVWDNWAPHGPQLALADYMLLRVNSLNSVNSLRPPVYGDNPGVVPFSPAQQGSIEYTGVQTHLAIDGPGFFVLDNEVDTVFTRIGDFAVDAEGYLVDPDTGRYVRRMPDIGEVEGFQTPGDLRILIPYDYAEPASATSFIKFRGNLRSGSLPSDATTNKLTANMSFTVNSGANPASATTYMSDLDQWIKLLWIGYVGQINITGYQSDGTTPIQVWVTWVGTPPGTGPTMQDILDQISAAFPNSTATLNADGKIVLTSDTPGYNRAMITGMYYFPAGADDLTIPTYFEHTTIGANDSKRFKIAIFDDMGEQHVLTGTFVKTDTFNMWDLFINDISGERAADWSTYDINSSPALNRRISGIEFNTDGSFKGLSSTTEQAEFSVQFANNPSVTQTISLDLGTPGEFTGLTQFSSAQSSAYATWQDGYEAGSFLSFHFRGDGTLVLTCSNGLKKTDARIATAVLSHPNYLSIIENDCYLDNERSGPAQIGQIQGYLRDKSLEIRPETIILTGTPMIVDHTAVQGGLKEVSFDDALSLRGMSWRGAYEDDPCFAKPGKWIDHSDGTVSWKSGNYRLLPMSKYIDASIICSGLPEHDIAGNDRVVTFNEGAGGIVAGPALPVALPVPTTIRSGIITDSGSQIGLPDLPELIEINPGIIPPPPFKINPDLLRKSMADLGAYESSQRAIEASVRIYPNTIEDISSMQLYRDRLEGNTESPFDNKWAYVMIHVSKSELGESVFNQKRIGLVTETGCQPVRAFAFNKRRSETVCVAAIFDYHEFVQSVRDSHHFSHFSEIDTDVTLGFWIDPGRGAFLKTSGTVRYKRPGDDRLAPVSSGILKLRLQELQN